MRWKGSRITVPAVVLGLWAWASPGCTAAEKEKKPAPAAEADRSVAAQVGDQRITMEELDAHLRKVNAKAFQAFYDARRAALDQLITERLLAAEAAAQGKTAEEVQQGALAAAPAVTDADVLAFYEQNKARAGDRTLEQMSEQIKNYLTELNRQKTFAAFIGGLKDRKGVQILLEPPRADVKIADSDPAQGPKDAPIQIVEYSDFQ